MTQKRTARQVMPTQGSSNGQHTATVEADLLDDAVGEEPSPGAVQKPPVDLDLDDALGDEYALKHDLLEDGPPAIEVRPPKKREYFMVHPTHERVTQVVEYAAPDGVGRAYYLATSNMRRLIEEEDLKTVRLVLCMSLLDRSLFLWPMNEDDGRTDNKWNRSSRHVAELAKAYWTRRVSHRKSGGEGYGWKRAAEGYALPAWPGKTLKAWLTEAFHEGGRIIDSPEHPVFRALEARP
jgi:hypothetical protein